jgi:hypothetical protein
VRARAPILVMELLVIKMRDPLLNKTVRVGSTGECPAVVHVKT